MSWQAELDEIHLRRRWAENLGGPEAVDAQHRAGRLTIRERIARLVDAGSFKEVAKLTGQGTYDQNEPSARSCRLPTSWASARSTAGPLPSVARISPCAAAPAGARTAARADRAVSSRTSRTSTAFRWSTSSTAPGGSVTSIQRRGHAVFPGVHGFERSVELMGIVPVVSAVMGMAAGGPAGRAILSHFSVMVKGTSQIFAAGPPVVERSLGQKMTREELGGSEIAVAAGGTIDNAAAARTKRFAMIRRFLGYMPQNVWELPPRATTDDPSIAARKLSRPSSRGTAASPTTCAG